MIGVVDLFARCIHVLMLFYVKFVLADQARIYSGCGERDSGPMALARMHLEVSFVRFFMCRFDAPPGCGGNNRNIGNIFLNEAPPALGV